LILVDHRQVRVGGAPTRRKALYLKPAAPFLEVRVTLARRVEVLGVQDSKETTPV
jgi:hypothetical protein